MIAILEAVLAVIGAAVILLLVLSAVIGDESQPEAPVEVDLAAPYRDGLHTANRLRQAAMEAELQIYRTATVCKEIGALGQESDGS